MRASLLVSILGILFTACHPELGHSYKDYVPKRMRAESTSYYGSLEFNRVDSTFCRYALAGGDTLYGSYSIVGNQLYLIELGKTFRCDTIGNSDSTLFIFLYKFNSLPAVKYP